MIEIQHGDYGDDEEVEYFGDDDEYEEDGETETVSCGSCGTDVYEDALQCPVCGEYVTRTTSALAGRPRWFVALGILGIVLLIVALLVR